MIDWLLSAPLWSHILVILVAGGLLFSANRRQDKALMRGGIALLAVSIAWTVAARLIDTPTEQCESGSKAFVEAVVKKDQQAMIDLLHPDATLKMMGFPTPLYLNAKDISAAAGRASEEYGVSSAWISGMTTQTLPSLITVSCTIFSTQKATMDRPLQSTWQFEWQDLGGGWELYSIVCVQVQGHNVEDAVSRFPKKP